MFELEVPFRGQQARVWLLDIRLPNMHEVEFVYRVFLTDPEDDSEYELTQTTQEEREHIYAAIMKDLHELCS
jgi:hypothetical protein